MKKLLVKRFRNAPITTQPRSPRKNTNFSPPLPPLSPRAPHISSKAIDTEDPSTGSAPPAPQSPALSQPRSKSSPYHHHHYHHHHRVMPNHLHHRRPYHCPAIATPAADPADVAIVSEEIPRRNPKGYVLEVTASVTEEPVGGGGSNWGGPNNINVRYRNA